MADQVEREHGHDMRALKRQTIEILRRGAKKGRRVHYIWDNAGFDFQAWEEVDPRNAGVRKDEGCQMPAKAYAHI